MKRLQEIYKTKAIPAFKENVHAAPRIEKVVVNVGTGRLKDDKEREEVRSALAKITGQAPEPRPARIAIASFKTRKGMIIGYRVTLRSKRMYDFLERLVWSAIPRMRDFRGIKDSAIDKHGNLNIGIREHIIFPEMIGDDVRRIFSIELTILTICRAIEGARLLFESLGFPLMKK